MSIENIIRHSETLFRSAERTQAEERWKEISEFVLNNQFSSFESSGGIPATNYAGSTSNSSAGSKTTQRLFDNTAGQAAQDLASAFQGTLTNPATVWSRLRFADEDLNNNDDAVTWLEEANRIMHNKFNESNFDSEIAKGYQSFVVFGSMVLLLEENESLGFRFTAIHLANVAWAENKDGLVDTICHKFRLTARQAVQKWGPKVHPEITKCLEKNPEQEFTFLHCIKPRENFEEGLVEGKKRPIASIYIDVEHRVEVHETGFYEMPVLVGRWSLTPGERYGRGPGHIAIPEVRTLNKAKELSLRAYAKAIDPPMLANQRDVFGPLNLNPGTISLVKDRNGIGPIPSAARIDVMQIKDEDSKAAIRASFYIDKLLLPPRTETGEMTAFEISQRIEQMQRVLGPVLSRLNFELLNPLVTRSFRVLLRTDQLPPLPDILVERGVNVDIIFVNQLARAQQIQDVNTIQQWVQGLAVIAQMKPEIIDNINEDEIAKHSAKILGVPEDVVKNDKEVEGLRQQRAQQAQQAQMLEAGVQVADIGSKLSGGTDGTE